MSGVTLFQDTYERREAAKFDPLVRSSIDFSNLAAALKPKLYALPDAKGGCGIQT
ncbi:hypothetical protein [Leisingera sp. JC1]|uniref:hypothetical protein n=1 Tax=Leisingera sp. JC1 TaxID=1855282 RepID=UPI001585DB49|nr:hypothetical protein [Leisingera sp. JC1]